MWLEFSVFENPGELLVFVLDARISFCELDLKTFAGLPTVRALVTPSVAGSATTRSSLEVEASRSKL